MLCLPYTDEGCQVPWHYHFSKPHKLHNYMGHECFGNKVHALLDILSSENLAETFAPLIDQSSWHGYEQVQALVYYTPRYWQPMVAALVQAHFDPQNTGEHCLSYDDLHCNTCDKWVSKVLEFEHWDDMCGTCYRHSDECSCCDKCGYDPCECCDTCGQTPGWCECCSYCSSTPDNCECRICNECGYNANACGCHSNSTSQFGSTKVAPWIAREDSPIDAKLPRIGDCENESIDPVQAAADFYLLDAIKSLIRTSDLTFESPDGAERFYADRDRLVRSDNMLSALTVSAERSYRRLVDYLAPNFLAYAVPAVGGELRYHKAMKNTLPSDRSYAWDKFVDLVQTKGPETLFEADSLFNEFGGGAYGGKKWGDAAKVVGMYLAGDMPAWLFVDRVFTLQHNGGCFLNKVSWVKRNGLKWGLSKMLYVLNAHAGKNASGDENAPTDWTLLLQVASPEVAQMFALAERSIRRIARRYNASLAPLPRKSGIRKQIEYSF